MEDGKNLLKRKKKKFIKRQKFTSIDIINVGEHHTQLTVLNWQPQKMLWPLY